MSGAGSIMDMTARFRQNRNQLNLRQKRRREMREHVLQRTCRRNLDFYRDDIPPGVIRAVKQEIADYYKKERRKNIIISVVSFLFAAAVTVFAVSYFMTVI